MDQIFAIKILVLKYLGKNRKLHAGFMDLEKTNDRFDREALWNVLKIYGVTGQLMEEIKTFDREANTCVKVDGELSDFFAFGVGVRQGCVMSPWLFYILMDGGRRQMKAKVGNVSARLKLNGVDWSAADCLFADDTVLLAGSERYLRRVVDQFYSVCSKRKLRVNTGKSKVIVFERKEREVVNFGNPYRVSIPVDKRYEIVMGGERMEGVK